MSRAGKIADVAFVKSPDLGLCLVFTVRDGRQSDAATRAAGQAPSANQLFDAPFEYDKPYVVSDYFDTILTVISREAAAVTVRIHFHRPTPRVDPALEARLRASADPFAFDEGIHLRCLAEAYLKVPELIYRLGAIDADEARSFLGNIGQDLRTYPHKGTVVDLRLSKSAQGSLVLTFRVRDEAGKDITVDAAFSLIPWEEHIDDGSYPRPGMMFANSTYGIGPHGDTMMTVIDGDEEPAFIQIHFEPFKPEEHHRSETSAILDVAQIMADRRVIEGSEQTALRDAIGRLLPAVNGSGQTLK